jgi:hypothetical protein
MERLIVDGHYGGHVTIDLCRQCQAFWFDGREHLQLAPSATLRLFEVIHDARGPRRALPARLPCPRCDLRLLLTDDRQRATAFRYWRCAREHGRYMTFFDFLREKDFTRELDARQLADLRAHVRSVSCSNCGAPIDLAHDTVCSHCHTPLAMLDFEQVGRMMGDLRAAAERAAQPLPGGVEGLALALARERQQVDAAFGGSGAEWAGFAPGDGIVERGLDAVVSLLRRLP